MLEFLQNKKIILASKSPRRQDLLGGLELEFEIRTKEIDESFPGHLKGFEIAEFIAEKKAEAFKESILKDELLITSDTIVLLDDRILEKPKSKSEAIEMLGLLSGKKHRVVTAVCLTSANHHRLFHDMTEVEFNDLERDEILHYIDKYQPFDKAGSYGVQEFIGYIGIKSLRGCYYNVMGLPLQKLYRELKSLPSDFFE